MKRWTSLIVLFFCGAGLALWLARSFVSSWEPQLRSKTEKALSRLAHTEVQISTISLSLIPRIHLHNLRISDPTDSSRFIFQASDIVLTISLIDLPRALAHRAPIESVGLVSIESPTVNLSPEFIQSRLKGAPNGALPPLFTLTWENGTFHYKDSQAPNGWWTVKEARGAFKIRGPRVELISRGSLEQAQTVRFQFSSLGHHWNAQGVVKNGDVAGALAIGERFAHHPLLPPPWKARGGFNLDLEAAGKHMPKPGEKWSGFLKKGHLSFSGAELDPGNGAPLIRISGALRQEGTTVIASDLALTAAQKTIEILGNATLFGGDPRLAINAKSRDFDLSLLALYLGSPGWLSGKGDMELTANGPLLDPEITVRAHVPQGEMGRWEFTDANLRLRRLHSRWEFVDNTLRLLDGLVTIKGYSSDQSSDLHITGESISLQKAALAEDWRPFEGRLNFACNVRGALNALTTSGSFWASDFVWNAALPDSIKGDFEITPDHFQSHALSEHSAYSFTTEGRRSATKTTLDRLELRLPSGATLTGQGTLIQPHHALDLDFEASSVQIPQDAAMVKKWLPLAKGSIDVRGHFSGDILDPRLTARMSSRDMHLGHQAIQETSADIEWTRTELVVSKFSLKPGIQGVWRRSLIGKGRSSGKLSLDRANAAWISALLFRNERLSGLLSGEAHLNSESQNGSLDLELENGAWGVYPISHASLALHLLGGRLLIRQCNLDSRSFTSHFQGKGLYQESKGMHSTLRLEMTGTLHSPDGKSLWEAPVTVKADIHPGDHWTGEAELNTPFLRIQKDLEDPIHLKMHWNRAEIAWTDGHWGSQMETRGSVNLRSVKPELTANLQLRAISLAKWHHWLQPKGSETFGGDLSGEISVSGPSDDLRTKFLGHLRHALWQAIHFDSDFDGEWNKSGLQPLNASVTSASGGTLTFHGAYHRSGRQAQGTLKLVDFNLRPLGETLHFPRPLEGNAGATLSVKGPLEHILISGHVDGGPISYGAKNPSRVEHVSMDVKVAPAPNLPGTMRLSLSEGLAKTFEEEIRIKPGSFVDFAGTKESHLQIASDIRNLHLGIFTLFGGLDFDGSWQAKPEGFAVKGDAHTRSLFINDYELEEGHLDADYFNGLLRLKAPRKGPALVTGSLDFQKAPQLHFTDFFITGRQRQGLIMSGDIGPSLWNFYLNGRGLDMSTLGNLAGFPYPLEGTSEVSIRGTGDLAHPHVEGSAQAQNGRALGLAFRSGSAEFVWQDYRMTFTRLLLTDPGRYTLTGAGVLPLASKENNPKLDKTIDFSVRLKDSNLGLLKSFTREVREAQGSVEGLLQVTGTSDQPVLHGSFKVANGDIVGAHYFKHLTHFNVSMEFAGEDLVIREFRGQSGQGQFQIAGKIPFSGLEPRVYDLQGDITSDHGVDVQVPELAIPESPLAKRFRFLTTASHCDTKGHVTFQGPVEAPVFKGTGSFSNGHFSFPPSRKNPPPPELVDWFRRIDWDVDLRFSDGAWFENELVEANLVGALHLKGPSDRLRVDGGMDINEGKISYLGIEFAIEQARFDIRSEERDSGVINTPYVRGAAQSNVQAIDTVNGRGFSDPGSRLDIKDTILLAIDYAPVDQIKPRLTSLSNPNLSPDKVLARVTQLDTEHLSPQERNYLYQQQMVRLIDTSLATPLARNILKRTGLVDTMRVSRVIDPSNAPTPETATTAASQQQTAANLFANTKYTFEKNLSGRLSLGYGVRFEQTTTPDFQNKLDLVNDVELSYRWFRNVYLRGAFDFPSKNPSILPDRKVTIEPRWRFGWWGHTNKEKGRSTPTSPAQTP